MIRLINMACLLAIGGSLVVFLLSRFLSTLLFT